MLPSKIYLKANNVQINQQLTKPSISPITPTPPSTPRAITNHFPQLSTNQKHKKKKKHSKQIPHKKYHVTNTMIKHGYIPSIEYAKTLQGSVWKLRAESNKLFVIKITSKSLHNKKVASVDGTEIACCENILTESAILKYLTWNNPPSSLAKFIEFFDDTFNYFLVVENGGDPLLDFVCKTHQLILNGLLSIYQWQQFCKVAFKQIVELTEWMHNTMNCCHLDLSLENFVISDVRYQIDSNNQIKLMNDFQIKIIDFGLAEVFTKCDNNGLINFKCCKYVGKKPYKAPKVYEKEIFDARAADCWSLGIIIFAMITGIFPFYRASKQDLYFQCVMNNDEGLLKLITQFNKVSYFTVSSYDLLSRILKPELSRINIGNIKKHKLFADYD